MKSITEQLRESIESRKQNDPRIDAMVADVRLIRTEIRGLNQIGNFALGNSREAIMMVSELGELQKRINSQTTEIEDLKAELITMKSELADFVKWAKSKGKQ